MTRSKRPSSMESGELFENLPTILAPRRYTRPSFPVWTEHKANFIQRYLKLFIQITKHGTYIDGFAGPQRLELEHAWSARLVLQIRPPFLRHFFLCEANHRSFKALRRCVEQMPKDRGRTIELFQADFNIAADQILGSRFITEKEATFCLLDQRMFECHWKTVEKLAKKKSKMKIELFYFFGSGWVKRALAGVTRNQDIVQRWWGRGDYGTLKAKSREEISIMLQNRFRTELDYKFVTAYPIFKREHNEIVMYEMLHATDHEDAPELMNRAYRQAVRSAQKLAEQLTLIQEQGHIEGTS
jgi:three-Cys-motif partner protein